MTTPAAPTEQVNDVWLYQANKDRTVEAWRALPNKLKHGGFYLNDYPRPFDYTIVWITKARGGFLRWVIINGKVNLEA